jgi:competence protein ComEA
VVERIRDERLITCNAALPSVRPVPDLDLRRVALVAVLALVVVGLGVRQLAGSRASDAAAADVARTLPVAPAPGGDPASTAAPEVTVHVAGAVRRPGVYRLKRGSRVDDAVRLAGGAVARADLSAVNLAAVAEDGRQVLVPVKAPTGDGGGGTGGSSAPGSAVAPAKVNLNTATLEELDTLAGVGPATAQKILAHREQHGAFGSVEELGDVPGIGEVRLAALRDLVTV